MRAGLIRLTFGTLCRLLTAGLCGQLDLVEALLLGGHGWEVRQMQASELRGQRNYQAYRVAVRLDCKRSSTQEYRW
jgi:hypothetical protein